MNHDPPAPWAIWACGGSLCSILHSSLFPVVVLKFFLWYFSLFPVVPSNFSSWKCARGWGSKVHISDGGGRSSRPWSARLSGQGSLGFQDHPGSSQELRGANQETPRATQDRFKIPQERPKIAQERLKSSQERPKTTPRGPKSDPRAPKSDPGEAQISKIIVFPHVFFNVF